MVENISTKEKNNLTPWPGFEVRPEDGKKGLREFGHKLADWIAENEIDAFDGRYRGTFEKLFNQITEMIESSEEITEQKIKNIKDTVKGVKKFSKQVNLLENLPGNLSRLEEEYEDNKGWVDKDEEADAYEFKGVRGVDSEVEAKESIKNSEKLTEFFDTVKDSLREYREEKGLSHDQLREKDGEHRDQNYVDIYGRIGALVQRFKKLGETEDVSQEEFKNIKDYLTSRLNTMGITLSSEPLVLTEEMRVENQVDLSELKQVYEEADGLNEKITAAESLAQVQIKDLQAVFSSFETESEAGKEQRDQAVEMLRKQWGPFVTEINDPDISEQKLGEVMARWQEFVEKTHELVAKQNEYYAKAEEKPEEFSLELQQHFGFLQNSEKESGNEMYNQASNLVNAQYSELKETISANEKISEEAKEKLLKLSLQARNLFLSESGGLQNPDLKTKDRNKEDSSDKWENKPVTEQDVAVALQNWQSKYDTIMEKLSPEYRQWAGAIKDYRSARENLHAVQKEFDEGPGGKFAFLKLGKKRELREKLNQAGKEFDFQANRYANLAGKKQERLLERVKNNLEAKGKTPAEVEAYLEEREEAYSRGLRLNRQGLEAKTLAKLETPRGKEMMDRLERISAKMQAMPTWKKFLIGGTLAGTGAAGMAVIGGAALGATALASATAVARYGVMGAVTWKTGWSAGGSAGKFVYRLEGKNTQSKEIERDKTMLELDSGEYRNLSPAEVRSLIKNANVNLAKAIHRQKVRAAMAGGSAGVAGGVAMWNVADMAFDAVPGVYEDAQVRFTDNDPVGANGPNAEVFDTAPKSAGVGDVTGESPEVNVSEADVVTKTSGAPVLGQGEVVYKSYFEKELGMKVEPITAAGPSAEEYIQEVEAGVDTPDVIQPVEAETIPSVEVTETIKPSGEFYEVQSGDENNSLWRIMQGRSNMPQPEAFVDLPKGDYDKMMVQVEQALSERPDVVAELGMKVDGNMEDLHLDAGQQFNWGRFNEFINEVVGQSESSVETAQGSVPEVSDVPPPPTPEVEVAPPAPVEDVPPPPTDSSDVPPPPPLEINPEEAVEPPTGVLADESGEDVVSGDEILTAGPGAEVFEAYPEWMRTELIARAEGMSPEAIDELAKTIAARSEFLVAITGDNPDLMSRLMEVGTIDIKDAINEGKLAEMLSEVGIEGQKYVDLISFMHGANMLEEPTQLAVAIENGLRGDNLIITSNLAGDNLIQVKSPSGLFGLVGGGTKTVTI